MVLIAGAVIRVVGNVSVVIGPSRHAATRAVWQDIQLTTDLDRLAWLH